MIKIFKYVLDDTIKEFEIPTNARTVHVGLDPSTNHPAIWMMVETEAPRVKRAFRIFGTGWEIDIQRSLFVGTAICGELVWHIFEVPVERKL